MPGSSVDEQLTKYLTDVHSIEEQALAQLKSAPKIAGDPELSRIFEEHLGETKGQERLVRDRLEQRGAAPSKLKDAVGRVTGVPFVLFARSQPDTPGKLVAHAFSYEHMELAAYELLIRIAERAGDAKTVEAARRIRDEEGAMIERLSACFDIAVEASLRAQDADALEPQLVKYLTDAHAIEAQAIQLLQRGPKIAGDAELERLYAEHLEETRRQQRLVAGRLEALGASPSRLKDAAMRLGALNWGGFFQAQPDTPGKLAGFTFAFEHLEIAGYELLSRVARRAGDEETASTALRIRDEERAMAERLFGAFDRAVDASLEAVGATG
ncbi:MAG: ferritin-like domain-containing protein [Thermoleophilaceae bacterium]